MTEDQFEKLMLDIIKGVFEEKKMKSTLFIAVFFENSCTLTNKIS